MGKLNGCRSDVNPGAAGVWGIRGKVGSAEQRVSRHTSALSPVSVLRSSDSDPEQ